MTTKKIPYLSETPPVQEVATGNPTNAIPEQVTPERNALKDLPKGAENVQVMTNLKYTMPKPPEQPAKKIPVNQFPAGFNPVNTGNANENPIMDFLEQIDENETVYIFLTRLPDIVTGVKFNRPCATAEYFPLIPLNRASFLKDIQTVNYNSGGRFKGIIVDENMTDLGYEPLNSVTIPNPLNLNEPLLNTGNGLGSETAILLKHLEESERRQQEFFKSFLQTEKKDDFADFAKTFLMGKMKDIDKPADNTGIGHLPLEQQTMLALFREPTVTKTLMERLVGTVTGAFSTDEKAAETVAKTGSWVDKLVSGVMESPENQRMLFMLADKLIGAAGFFAAKYAENKNAPPPNRPTRPNQNQQNPTVSYEPPPVANYATPGNAVDGDLVELTAEEIAAENAIINSDLFKQVIAYVDGTDELITDNEFMKTAKQENPAQFGLAIAAFKYQKFEVALNTLYNELPFLMDFVVEGRKIEDGENWIPDKTLAAYRLERLEKYHGLLKDYVL